MPDDVTITTADKLLTYIEITSTQLLEQVKQFNGLVTSPTLRAECASNVTDAAVALQALGQSLRAPAGKKPLRAWVNLSIHQRKTQPHPHLQ